MANFKLCTLKEHSLHPASCMYKVDQSAILLLSVSTPRADQRKFCLERSYCTVEVIPGIPNGTPWGWVPNRLSLLFFIYTFVATQPRFSQGISPKCHERSRTKIVWETSVYRFFWAGVSSDSCSDFRWIHCKEISKTFDGHPPLKFSWCETVKKEYG